ncbi:MAG TPA: zinc-binding dehydrogenase [Frankiaceae bacterium]|jgi:NADPH:quinone reductase-like Zn-dependent oxidoreductase|nr:zinc-binding dehydrogenase [Frankiaceae bacterium]
MRAAFHEQQGDVSVLRVGEQPDPELTPDQVLIRTRATSLDRVDLYFREGSHGMSVSGAHIGGRDVAGTVEAVGSLAHRVAPFVVGAEVVGVAVQSAHAELVAVPAALVFPLPAGCSFEQAAAIPTAGRTAFDGLINRGRLAAGENVLVVAGGSGVGSFAIQIARAAGALVVATVGSAWKAEHALALGAAGVINHHAEDDFRSVGSFTGGQPVDVALDPVGAATFAKAMRTLGPDGRYVTTGVTVGHRADLHLGQVFQHGLTVTGVGRPDNLRIRETMHRLLRLVSRGDVKPVVHASMPLEQIAEAHQLLAAGEVFGKLVLTL